MLERMPEHPYPEHTRVHSVREDDPYAFAYGAASVVEAHPRHDGTFSYTVHKDGDGEQEEWPSYFTIPAQTWASPRDIDPLFGARAVELAQEATAAPSQE